MTIATFTNSTLGVRAIVTYTLGQYRVTVQDIDAGLDVGSVTRSNESDAIAYAQRCVNERWN